MLERRMVNCIVYAAMTRWAYLFVGLAADPSRIG